MNSQHYPVMHREVTGIFQETDKKWFIDCTLGMGGHTRQVLQHFPNCRVIALDVDDISMEQAKINLQEFSDRVEFVRMNFTSLFNEVDLTGKEISGILIDPGLSVDQLKDGRRGFSHSLEAPLDMRKDKRSRLTAYDIINQYKEKELIELFETYGETRRAPALAKKIIETRLFGVIETTSQLADIVGKFYHWKPKKGKTHPAANVFQALRIAVNNELKGIDSFIEKIPCVLPRGARIVFLTFHSVEDRIVKQTFTKLQREGKISIIKPFPAVPTEQEIAENLPSRSTKLRAGVIL